MDPVSQGVVGAVAAAVSAKEKREIRLAVLIGWTGGMLADADIFIRSPADPLLTIEFHRHFTHSLAFIPIGGALCAALWWLLFRARKPFRQLLLFATAGYATSGLLDACTSYGTQLLWPFSDVRVAWNIISIIDPVFTGVLLLLVAGGTIRRSRRMIRGAAVFALAYLLLGGVQNFRASRVQMALAGERGHAGTKAMAMATTKPSIGNLLLWRSIYRHEGRFYLDAIRVGLPGSSRVFPGSSVPAVEAAELKQKLPPESTLARDIDRFDHFSSRYLARHPEQADVVGDLRYAMLPNETIPLWGIRYDPAAVDEHVSFESFRTIKDDDKQRLFRMIFSGKE